MPDWQLQVNYEGKWVVVAYGNRSYVQGYLDARCASIPHPPYRIVNPQGKITREEGPDNRASIGMVCGWPTADQLFRGAIICLRQVANGFTGGQRAISKADQDMAVSTITALEEYLTKIELDNG